MESLSLDRPTERSTSIPSDEEVTRALRRAWFPVARGADLERPQGVQLLGESLVVFRSGSGELGAVRDQCPHRGAALSDGYVQGESLVCPYHGWQWRGDGSCAHIPSLSEGAAIPPKAKVDSFQVAEKWGLVWCVLDEPAVPLPEPDALEGLSWKHGAGKPMHVAAGLRAAVENFRDVAHFPFVHRETMGEMPEQIEPLQVERSPMQVKLARRYDASGGQEAMWHEGMTFRYHAIAPAFVCLEMDGGDDGMRILLNAPCPHTAPDRPADDGRHRTTIFWAEGFTEAYTAMTLEECLAGEAEVYEEDNPILDRLTPSEAPLDPAEQVHTPSDKYVMAYRQAFLEFVEFANAD